MKRVIFILLLASISLAQTARANAQQSGDSALVKTADLDAEVMKFLGRELALHLADIKSYDPPPAKVLGGGATGEYTWGTFMNALGAYAALSKNQRLADRELALEVRTISVHVYPLGGTSFFQTRAVFA